MIEPRPYLLYNKIQNYAWGTKGADAFIPKLLGIQPEPDTPYAELWMGAHPRASSEIIIDGQRQSLYELIEQYPDQILGRENVSEFGITLPYLFKILSAGEPLSIQAHPSKEQAKLLHNSDPMNYPDENHKPEIAIVLDELTALVGFKDYESIKSTVEYYRGFQEYVEDNIYEELVGSNTTSSTEKTEPLRRFYSSVIRSSVTEPAKFRGLIDSIKTQIKSGSKDTRPEHEKLFLSMFNKYGYDIGLISIIFFNLVKLKSGEAIYTPAGFPHAYVGGNIIECMANSDNVIRAGLTSKFKDINNLLELMDYTPANPELVKTITSARGIEYNTPAKEFRVSHLNLEMNQLVTIRNNQPGIILVVEGSAEIIYNGGTQHINKGESVFLPAMLAEYKLKCAKASNFFIAGIN